VEHQLKDSSSEQLLDPKTHTDDKCATTITITSTKAKKILTTTTTKDDVHDLEDLTHQQTIEEYFKEREQQHNQLGDKLSDSKSKSNSGPISCRSIEKNH